MAAMLIIVVVELMSACCLWLLRDPQVGLPGDGAARQAEQDAPTGDPSFRHANVLHPFLGYVLNPETVPGLGDSAQARGLGLPFNVEDPIQAVSPEILVVALFGGSVAEQTFIYARRELSRGLGAVERFSGRRIVLVNMAVGGYKQPQQLQALSYLRALGGHVDVAINLDGFNEIALIRPENIELGTHPSFPRSWKLRVAELSPAARRLVAEIAWLEESRKRWAGFGNAPWRWSTTVRLVRSRMDRWHLGAIGARELRLRELESGESDFQAAGPPFRYANWDDFYAEAGDLWSRSSWLMHQAMSVSGGEYHHFLQPNQYIDGSKPLSEQERRLAFVDGPFRRDVGRGYPKLIAQGEHLRRRGVSFHSLVRIFAQRQQTLYVDTCCHLNADGYRLMAREIVERIAARAASPEAGPGAQAAWPGR